MSISRNRNFTNQFELFMRTNVLYACREDRLKGGLALTANQIAYWNLQETKRSNLIREGETNRHNLVTEGIQDKDVESQIKRRAAQTKREYYKDAGDMMSQGFNAMYKLVDPTGIQGLIKSSMNQGGKK